ncbi:hypothetical protein DB30_06603 [Enhygromyxa salina]|uniref:Protein nucleotidyltransferase YdiU n=1 Tax=Enhygromyxa salina TaxID=215803 RepID=A0A0C2DH36_9BACT|nr:YdiU family protein [Enhygromyxa salina]KIG18992.1 hypothetical protein DB30_06603 [Enhygromyxa salina]
MSLDLPFDNSFTHELPADPEPDNFRRAVHGACYSRVQPTPVAAPTLLAWSPEVARLVGLPEDPQAHPELAQILSGNQVLPGMDPYAACYGGHQFGNWADQLGDGRAITLGEVLTPSKQRWELQLKGAGPTPYSRRGDGRAVLRSSVREFLCSEAMHHLGVPTTRALSLVGTGDEVVRDMFYDGNAKPEPGAIVCRVAPSFLRFGNFELPMARGEHELLRQLADYAITTHFPELLSQANDAGQSISASTYAAWFTQVCQRTATMVAEWMRVGFVHGVMNTDNMSVLGLTIDYGPYGWIDNYDPDWTPNTTDAAGRRYRFGNQPRIAMWNLVKFANALHPLVGSVEPFEDGMRAFSDTLGQHTLASFAAKLGLEPFAGDEDPEDPRSGVSLANQSMRVLGSTPTDMTIFYRALADVPVQANASDDELLAPLWAAYYEADPSTITPATRSLTLAWLRQLGERVRGEAIEPAHRRARMHAANPKYVLRNYLAQLAIDKAEAGDPSLIHELLEVMRHPYAEQPTHEQHAAKRPDWAKDRAGCSMLSCSS